MYILNWISFPQLLINFPFTLFYAYKFPYKKKLITHLEKYIKNLFNAAHSFSSATINHKLKAFPSNSNKHSFFVHRIDHIKSHLSEVRGKEITSFQQ